MDKHAILAAIRSYATAKGEAGAYLDHARWHAQHGESGHGDSTVWFHGTKAAPFQGFQEHDPHAPALHLFSRLGLHFTSDPEQAGQYAEQEAWNPVKGGAPSVVPVRLRITKPLVLRGSGYDDDEVGDDDELGSMLASHARSKKIITSDEYAQATMRPDSWRYILKGHPRESDIAQAFVDHLKERGYDGIIHAHEGYAADSETKPVTAIAFHPSQIEGAYRAFVLNEGKLMDKTLLLAALRSYADEKIANQAGYTLKNHRWHANAHPDMSHVRNTYLEKADIDPVPLTQIKKIDQEFSKRVAQAYEEMPMWSADALPAYDALGTELEAQYKHLTDHGYKFDLHYHDFPPYVASSEMNASDSMREDLHNNKHMDVFATASGHGNEPFQHHYKVVDGQNVPIVDEPNPLLKHVVGMSTEEKPVLLNDLFRGVHDAFGHGVMPHQFGPLGEDNAYREHAATLSPLAVRALTTETRGQNSWVNFGPQIVRPDGSIPKKSDKDYKPPADRKYAEQKIALLPEWADDLKIGTPNE